MAAPAGIDYDWALRTGGKLSPRQKHQLLRPLVRAVLTYPAARLRIAVGSRGRTTIDLDAFRWPDSSLAVAAVDEARATLEPFVLQHSLRTYLFASMLAQAGGISVDEETAFVACVLHDLRLGRPNQGTCFAVAGAVRARDFCTAHGASTAQATVVGAAIAGHITAGALGDPAGFVSAGAFADLTGVGLQHTTASWVTSVTAAHPRGEAFRENLLRAWNVDADAVPDGRARWLRRYAALPALMRLAPFS